MGRVELAEKERLQPSLLDRLTDHKPGELKESARERVIDIRRLRQIIERDLAWLLNTANNSAMIDPEIYPHTAVSTLNYGVEDVAGKLAAKSGIKNLERMIKNAIYALEPRVIQGSLDVRTSSDIEGAKSQIAIDIRAALWASPVPVELYLRTHLDVADGSIQIDRVR